MKSEPPPPAYHPTAYSAAPPTSVAAPIDTRPINQQYRSPNAPTFNPAPTPEKPQFARFDAPSRPANEDALPAMPTMSDARDLHVEEEVIPEKRGDMEMDRLDHNGSVAGSSLTGTAVGTAVSSTARRSPGPGRSPVHRSPTQDSYGFPAGYQNNSFGNVPPQRSPHNSPGPYGRPYGQPQDGYRGASPAHSLSPVYGAGAGYAQNQNYDRRSPGPGYKQPYRQPSPGHSPAPVASNGYGYSAPPPAQEPISMPEHAMYQNDSYTQAPARSDSPGYAPSGSTKYDQTGPSYPGQQTYQSSDPAYPGQQTYHAYSPSQPQDSQYSPVTRKAVEGSWKGV